MHPCIFEFRISLYASLFFQKALILSFNVRLNILNSNKDFLDYKANPRWISNHVPLSIVKRLAKMMGINDRDGQLLAIFFSFYTYFL